MDPSSVVENRLQLHHNARDHDEIIRAYIDTILGKFFLHSNYYIFQLAIIKITDYNDKSFSTLVNIFTILGVAFLYTFIMTNSVLQFQPKAVWMYNLLMAGHYFSNTLCQQNERSHNYERFVTTTILLGLLLTNFS